MSRRKKSSPNNPIARRQPQLAAGATNFQPVNDKIVEQMYLSLGPQAGGTTMYAPGAPIRPIPGITPPEGPRQFEYEVGYNIGQLPRGTEEYSFADLRNIARVSDAVQLCQQVWFDYVSKLEMAIELRPELVNEDEDASKYADDIAGYAEFFATPDKDHDLHSWLRMLVKDQLEIDAGAVYVRKDRMGRPYSLDVLDGATIKPLIDDRGRKPQPPFPAYEQFVYGVPACFLTADDLIYIKETERSDSVYGRSRIERTMIRINQGLRKQTKDLTRFTDGSIPAGVLETTLDLPWTLEQIETYESMFNNLLGGNDQARARVKVLPRGMTYKPTDDLGDVHTDLDQWILNVVAACHGLTMDELAMTGDSNRSVGQTQENVVYRRAIAPLMSRYAKLFTHILVKYFGETRFVVKWKGFEEQEDFSMLATSYSTLVTAGIQSPTQAAKAMHLPVYQDTDIPPFVMTMSGPIILEDVTDPTMRDLQKQSQAAGLKMAIANPGQKPGEGAQDDSSGTDDGTGSTAEGGNENPSKSPPDDSRAISAEYRRWREVSLKDLKERRPVRTFASTLIPSTTLSAAHLSLERCETADEVKGIFEAMRKTQ